MKLPKEPFAKISSLVNMVTQKPVGEMRLIVGNFMMNTEEWEADAAKKYLPLIVRAVNEYAERNEITIENVDEFIEREFKKNTSREKPGLR